MKNWIDEIKSKLEAQKVITSKDCWQLRNNNTRYPYVWLNGQYYQISRITKEIYQGIKIYNHALHKCDNEKCWNPDHIFDGMPIDNYNDALKKNRSKLKNKGGTEKFTCINGHKFTPETTVFYKKKNGQINKNCKICIAQRNLNKRIRRVKL